MLDYLPPIAVLLLLPETDKPVKLRRWARGRLFKLLSSFKPSPPLYAKGDSNLVSYQGDVTPKPRVRSITNAICSTVQLTLMSENTWFYLSNKLGNRL